MKISKFLTMKKRSLQLCPKKKFPFEILSFIKKKNLSNMNIKWKIFIESIKQIVRDIRQKKMIKQLRFIKC